MPRKNKRTSRRKGRGPRPLLTVSVLRSNLASASNNIVQRNFTLAQLFPDISYRTVVIHHIEVQIVNSNPAEPGAMAWVSFIGAPFSTNSVPLGEFSSGQPRLLDTVKVNRFTLRVTSPSQMLPVLPDTNAQSMLRIYYLSSPAGTAPSTAVCMVKTFYVIQPDQTISIIA